MRALVFHSPWELTVEDRPDPEAGAGEVLLEVIATGICGSDIHGYTGENQRRHAGQVMGHETVGRVVAGDGALAAGTIATVNPVIGCGDCAACHAGATQRCAHRRVIGVTADISSAFAERLVVPATNVVPLPAQVPIEAGSLVEPLAVGYHAARRVEIAPCDTVLVIGGGPIGQAAALAARRMGSQAVAVSELSHSRRDLVRGLGFATIDPAVAPVAETLVAQFGAPATVVLDAVGTSQTLDVALTASEYGSRVALVGMNTPTVELPAYAVSTEERSLLGSFCYDTAEFEDTAAWAAAHGGELAAALIDARVGLDDAPDTFHQLASGQLRRSKVLVYMDGSSAQAQPEGTAA